MLDKVLRIKLASDDHARDFSSFYYYYYYYYYLVCEAIGTAATPGLLCQPRVIVKMIVEKQMECILAGETEVLGEKTCPSATFVHHKIPHNQTRF
jgi:hypothetical protein